MARLLRRACHFRALTLVGLNEGESTEELLSGSSLEPWIELFLGCMAAAAEVAAAVVIGVNQ